MKIRVKRFDSTMPLPKRHSERAAAFDLPAREAVTIPARQVGYIPLNVALETPAGHFLLIAARSSAHKKGIMLANGIGIGDPDYSGDNDEYKAVVYNFTDKSVTVEKGERIAQGMFVRSEEWEWDEVTHLGNESRGGFGSTGKS